MKKILKSIFLIAVFFISISSFSQKKWSLEECITHAKQHNFDIIKQHIQNELLKIDITIAK